MDPEHSKAAGRHIVTIRHSLRRTWERWRTERGERSEAVRELDLVGFTRAVNTQLRARVTAGGLLVTFLVLLVLRVPEAAVGGLVALGAVLVGAQQFASARNEVSLDRFYDRLHSTNEKLESWPAARAFIGTPETESEADFQKTMYVFAELDNLEYAIAKYRIGFMSPENAHRALRTFRSRGVASAEFMSRALTAVHGFPGDRDPGYDAVTKTVVASVARGVATPATPD